MADTEAGSSILQDSKTPRSESNTMLRSNLNDKLTIARHEYEIIFTSQRKEQDMDKQIVVYKTEDDIRLEVQTDASG